MKQTIIYIVCLLYPWLVVSAQIDGTISYYPVVVGEGIPIQTERSLTVKMEQAVTQNGFGTGPRADRFVILAKCSVLEKNIAPTAPPRITQIIEVTFILGDVIENKTYSSKTFELKGIGTNETKAWQVAFNSLKSGNPQFKAMFEEAMEKIESYYSANCKKIIAKAQTLASVGQYDHAIASLITVPDVSIDCHAQVLTEVIKIYKQKIDAEGTALLSKAKIAWAAKPDADGAEEALNYIGYISPASASFADADALVAKIAEKLSSDKERKWQQRLREYNDEKEFCLREQDNLHAHSMATIAACRSVAEKWAETQTQTKVFLNW